YKVQTPHIARSVGASYAFFTDDYLKVLSCASENGLSLRARGREKLAATQTSTGSSAVILARILLPRSVCSVGCRGRCRICRGSPQSFRLCAYSRFNWGLITACAIGKLLRHLQ